MKTQPLFNKLFFTALQDGTNLYIAMFIYIVYH